MARPATPEKTCPNCSLLHTRWGETCRERLMQEVRALRAQLAAAPPPSPPDTPAFRETTASALPFPDNAGPPCGACRGRGRVHGDCHPCEVCGTCNGTGYPQSWAKKEIDRLDAEVHALRRSETEHEESWAKVFSACLPITGTADSTTVGMVLRLVEKFKSRPALPPEAPASAPSRGSGEVCTCGHGWKAHDPGPGGPEGDDSCSVGGCPCAFWDPAFTAPREIPAPETTPCACRPPIDVSTAYGYEVDGEAIHTPTNCFHVSLFAGTPGERWMLQHAGEFSQRTTSPKVPASAPSPTSTDPEEPIPLAMCACGHNHKACCGGPHGICEDFPRCPCREFRAPSPSPSETR